MEDRRNLRESSCNSGDETDQRVQSLMFMMMMMIMKPKGKRQLRRSGRRCKGNAKMDVKVMDLEYMNYIRGGLLRTRF